MKMRFLDGSRSPEYPDDVLVYLLKEGNDPEGCWVRMEGLEEHRILGELLNEPKEDFGFHQGDLISIYIQKDENENILLYSDMNEEQKLTAEDLEDGVMLEIAISTLRTHSSKHNFIELLQILRDSVVVIPCSAVLSEKDKKKLEEMAEGKEEKSLKELIGTEFSLEEDMRLVPDILQGGDAYYFPVFSNEEAMGEYGNGFSKVYKSFPEAVSMAENNEKELAGIVVNAFSESFVLDKKLWNVVKKLNSRL